MNHYTVFVDLGDVRLMVQPNRVSQGDAVDQTNAVCSHMQQFPGGTQSIRVWKELCDD